MAALVIPNSTPFGGMTNQTTSRLLSLNTTIARLKDAVATAASGYEGTPGTEYEAGGMSANMWVQNNFGVAPKPDEPGAQGTDYAYAVNQLVAQWETFWPLVEPFVSQLDNGGTAI
jgi:hypothetical protein